MEGVSYQSSYQTLSEVGTGKANNRSANVPVAARNPHIKVTDMETQPEKGGDTGKYLLKIKSKL